MQLVHEAFRVRRAAAGQGGKPDAVLVHRASVRERRQHRLSGAFGRCHADGELVAVRYDVNVFSVLDNKQC